MRKTRRTTKKDKKAFYKNWKTYAIAAGVAAIGTAAGLGIYYGVNANHHDTAKPSITEEDIVTAIAKQTYNAKTTIGSSTNTINDQIIGSFIKAKLSGDVNDAFIMDFFKFREVRVDGHTLTAEDLKEVKEIDAHIDYNYRSAQSFRTNLKITIASNS